MWSWAHTPTLANREKGQDALATGAHLRQVPAPLADDPRIDLQEAYGSNQVSDYKRVQVASDNAARKSELRGARLLLAQAKIFQSTAARNLQDLDKAKTLDDEAEHIYESVGDRYGAARARIRMADVLWRRGAAENAPPGCPALPQVRNGLLLGVSIAGASPIAQTKDHEIPCLIHRGLLISPSMRPLFSIQMM